MLFADLFTLNLNIGSSFFTLGIDIGQGKAFSEFLAITVSLAGYTITYNLLDLLLILGISIVASVLVERIAHQTTPGGLFGGFLIALFGLGIFIPFVPLTWNQDFKVPTTHVQLITSFIGAPLPIMVGHICKRVSKLTA